MTEGWWCHGVVMRQQQSSGELQGSHICSHLHFWVHEPCNRLLDSIEGVLLDHHNGLHILKLLTRLAGPAPRPDAAPITAPEVAHARLGREEGGEGLGWGGLGHA